MKRLKTITIQGQQFVWGKTECPVCEHKFRFILTREALLFWEHHCSVCSTVMPKTVPPKGKMTVEGLNWD